MKYVSGHVTQGRESNPVSTMEPSIKQVAREDKGPQTRAGAGQEEPKYRAWCFCWGAPSSPQDHPSPLQSVSFQDHRSSGSCCRQCTAAEKSLFNPRSESPPYPGIKNLKFCCWRMIPPKWSSHLFLPGSLCLGNSMEHNPNK